MKTVWCPQCLRLWLMELQNDAGKAGVSAFRNPPRATAQDPNDDWLVAHGSKEAISLIDEFGPPYFMDLDHDLGKVKQEDGTWVTDSVMVVLDYLIEHHYDVVIEYKIHSMNPDGAKNIDAKMKSWKRSKEL